MPHRTTTTATKPLLQRPTKSLLFQALLLFQVQLSEAVRFHRGCYERHPVSCDVEVTPLEDIDFDLQEVCSNIEKDVFEYVNFVIRHPSFHEPYLNGVEPESEFCSQIHQVYSHCSFCAEDSESFQNQCVADAFKTRCGGQPTLEEVLWDNDEYPQFQTEKDIDETCDQLIQIYNISDDLGYDYPKHHPKTIDLCEKQHQVKHLCDGYCKGGCFDAPPTCDISSTGLEAIYAENSTVDDICRFVRQQVFGALTNEQLMDRSLHADYLLEVSHDNPVCPLFKEAYSHCFWCMDSDALCFDASEPPSCEVPEPLDLEEDEKDHDEVNRICTDIFSQLPFFDRPANVYDRQWHTDFLYILENTTLCEEARQSYHKCVWCEDDVEDMPCLVEKSCHIDPPVPESVIADIKTALNITAEPTKEECRENVLDYFVYNVTSPVTRKTCQAKIALRKMCPEIFCQDDPRTQTFDKHNYLGTTTTLERKALIWASRFSAILSFIGASYILYDILSNPQSRKMVYHRLLIGMAIFDIVTAVAWGFATAPIDKEQGGHIEGATGTEATCMTQAFFIQLGFTSIFYNVSLSLYYVLVIAYNWREFQLQKVQRLMHALPVALGLALALGAIPSYQVMEYGCHLLPGDFWPVLVFVVLPLGLSIVVITGCMVLVYVKVKQQTIASRKWSFGIGRASALEQAVFWQCLFYVLAFYVTWPIMFSVYLASVDIDGPLGLTMIVAFVAPLQGFNNAVIYCRSKLQKRKRQASDSGRSSVFGKVCALMRQGTDRAPVDGASSETAKDVHRVILDPSAALAHQATPIPTQQTNENMPAAAAEGTESTTMEGHQSIELGVIA